LVIAHLLSLFISLPAKPIKFESVSLPPLHIEARPAEITQKTNETEQMILIRGIFERNVKDLISDVEAEMNRTTDLPFVQ
ncbi:hypothetical protein PENTCL1PPCAC_25715, partial [Pristionchus entomophagus]